jgi:uncharacterized RDD family membrane protein YckC
MTTYPYAGFWRRFVAYTIDSFIIFFVFLTLTIVAGVAYFTGALSHNSQVLMDELTHPEQLGPVGMVILSSYTFLFIGYFTFFHGLTGRTPGKKLLVLQVVHTDGSPISFGTAFLRSVGYLVSSLLFTIPLGYIWAAFDKKKQAWHDKIAGTVVIIREPPGDTDGISISDSGQPPQGPVPFGGMSGDIGQMETNRSGTAPGEDAAGMNGQKIP